MMNRRQLTAKQYAFFHYIKEHINEYGQWPSYADLVSEFDFKSPNSVTQNLQALVKKGYLRRDNNGYHLLHEDQVIRERGIPIRGMITAGGLQEAVEANMGEITLETLFPHIDKMFALKVHGQSMIGEGIYDGDCVLLLDEDIPNGGIGAIMYNGETTLKRVFHDERGIRLEAANEEYADIFIHPKAFEEVRVLGRYIGRVTHATGITKIAA
jgi:repressor LexA